MLHGAGIVVVRNDGAVLMQHRDNKTGIFRPNHWAYPGGRVNKNEDFKTAALRELYEETSYKAQKAFKLFDEIYERSDGVKIHKHIYWTIYDGKQKIECNEGQEMKFVKESEFKEKKVLPEQVRLFKLAIEKFKKSKKSHVLH